MYKSTGSTQGKMKKWMIGWSPHDKTAAHHCQGSGLPTQPLCHAVSCSHLELQASTTDTNPKRSKRWDGVISSLNVTIEALNLAKEISGIVPAKVAFGSVSALLMIIRVPFFPFYDDDLQTHIHPGLDGQ